MRIWVGKEVGTGTDETYWAAGVRLAHDRSVGQQHARPAWRVPCRHGKLTIALVRVVLMSFDLAINCARCATNRVDLAVQRVTKESSLPT